MGQYDLLNKTEVRIDKIFLKKANLTDIAANVADILGFNKGDVRVVDYRDDSMTLDILNACVNAYSIVGKKDQLLNRLGSLPGVCVSEETSIHSDGMLGWIVIDEEVGKQALRQSEEMLVMKNVKVSSSPLAEEVEARSAEHPTIMQCLHPKVTRSPRSR
jgi:hypothetical protein